MGINIKKKQIFITSLLIIIAGWITYKALFPVSPPAEVSKLVEVEVAKKSDLEKTATLVGTVKPVRQTTFIAHGSGVLKTPQVHEGQQVKKGTVLIEIENDELVREVNHARESVALLEHNYQRQEKLVKMNNKSKKSLEGAREDLLKARIEYEKASNRLKMTQFIAPYDGTCGVFIAREGQDLKEGDQVVTFYDTSKYALDIGVPESILPKVQEKAKMSCLGKESEIKSIQRLIDPKSRMGLAHAEISNEVEVCLGSIVDVRVVVEKKLECLNLPKSAVFMKGEEYFVYTIKDGKADLVPVELGLEGDDRVEITTGIKEGDQVILLGQESIWPTKPVKAVDTKTKEKA